jgi:hypothetical protein
MELATLFFVRCSELYLHDHGTIGFLLPHSVFRADHHDRFRQQQFTVKLGFREAWDLEGVKPLFNVAACVVFGEKGVEAEKSLPGERISGTLSVRNATCEEAAGAIRAAAKEFRVYQVGSRSVLAPSDEGIRESTRSPYAERFRQGATIFPRSGWFVQASPNSGLGFDTGNPYLQTDPRAEEKAQKEYQGVHLEGQVEAEFVYATLLSTDLVPFGHLPFRPVVLPILQEGGTYEILTATQARHEGYLGLASWLERAEEVWKEKRGEKAEKMSIYERLDRYKGITQQRSHARFRVMYPDMTRVLFSGVVDEADLASRSNEQPLDFRGLVVESMLYYYETENEEEAFYLEAVLNSAAVDKLLATFRQRRQFNVPHVHTKLWEFPIPLYDRANPNHAKLVGLGRQCHERAGLLLASLSRERAAGSLGRLRNTIRDHLHDALQEVDAITKSVMR